jgi:hypothetical protein
MYKEVTYASVQSFFSLLGRPRYTDGRCRGNFWHSSHWTSNRISRWSGTLPRQPYQAPDMLGVLSSTELADALGFLITLGRYYAYIQPRPSTPTNTPM